MRSVKATPKYHGMPATSEDYFNLEDDGFRYELIHGRLILVPSPIPEHQDISIILTTRIQNFLFDNPICKLYYAPLDVHIGDEVYQPDILFISNDNKDLIIENHIIGPPDLIVEILSPSTAEKDFGVKFNDYEKYGVKEYWIVDPQTGDCDFFVSVDGKFKSKEPIDNLYHSTILDGFTLNIEELRKEI